MAIYNSVNTYTQLITYKQNELPLNILKGHVLTKEGDNVYMGIFIGRWHSLLHRASGEVNC